MGRPRTTDIGAVRPLLPRTCQSELFVSVQPPSMRRRAMDHAEMSMWPVEHVVETLASLSVVAISCSSLYSRNSYRIWFNSCVAC